MYDTGGPKVDMPLIAYLHLWLKFWEGIDKYWIVLVRKLFYFHHWLYLQHRVNSESNCLCLQRRDAFKKQLFVPPV